MNKTLIVDYGLGNVCSVKRSFEECGADVVISDDPALCEQVDHIVLPGVGAFADGMAALTNGGWVNALRTATQKNRIPLLGICLGMQLLADKGFEGGATDGLGLIPGEVRRLAADAPGTRIPHVGWNEVLHDTSRQILSNIPSGVDFYFAHSYHFVPDHSESIVATTPYCGTFVSIVTAGQAYGTQFHPEKSSLAGFQLIRNFLAM